jgi:phosphatidylglycerophosphatase A
MEKRGAADEAVLFLATGFYSGYSPVAPGTAGSIMGVWLFCLIHDSPFYVPITLAVVLAGVAASGRAETLFGRKDDKRIVIDEVAGQLIALYASPFAAAPVAAGFLFFRLFDIWKVWPIRLFEKMRGGWGVMMDDVAAGFFALAFCRVIIYSFAW